MAIQFGNIDRELADRQNVIKEDAARQYRGSRDMMQSVTDLGDTISREVKEYKANQRADQRLDYKFKRDEENAKVRDEQHNMNIMKTQLDANTLMLDRAQASYMMKKWPYGKMATHKRYEEEKQEWRDSDIHETIDKIYAFGSLYSEEALRAVRIHQTIKNSEKGFEDERAEAASLRKISRFQPVKVIEWATNNGLYDPKDYGDPTAQANADATNIINKFMPGTITDANEYVKRANSGLTFTRYSPEGSGVKFTGSSDSGKESQDGGDLELTLSDTFSQLLDDVEVGRQTGTEVPETTTGDDVVTETTDKGVQFKEDKKPGWWNYGSVLGRQKIKDYENRDMTNKLILDRDPHETTNSEIYHNLRVLEGDSGGEVIDDNTRLIVAGSVDANGLINKSPEQKDMLITMLGITDPAKKKEWESYLMSDNVNSDYGYVKPGSATGPRQDTRTSEQEQKRSLLKLNPDQVSKLQRWAYNKSLGEMDRNHPHLSGGEAYANIPYLKHILGDMGYRHGSSFMVPGGPGRYPKFGKAVKELTEAVKNERPRGEWETAWEKMDKELFSTGIYSKSREGKSGKETKRFRFLRDRMDRLKNWITEGQYKGILSKGGGFFGTQYKLKK